MKLRSKFIILLFLPTFNLFASAAQLSAPEIKMRDYLSQKQGEQLSLLEKLVNINSGTENIEGVNKIGEMLRPEFEALGFKTRWEQGITPMKRAATLIIEREGNKGKRLLLIGHLDTVFPKNSPFQRFQKNGNKATGPGVIDDKGGILVILYALKALHAVKALEGSIIRIALTGDEESSGKPTAISRKPLVDLAKKSDIALDFEPSTIRGTASIARRGGTHWKIEATGKEGHSSQIFKPASGYGAIFELIRILNEMRSTLSHEENLTFNVGTILGGTQVNFDPATNSGSTFGKNNIIPKAAMATGDLRYLTSDQKIQAQKRITAIVNQSLSGTSATVQFQDAMPAMPPTPNNAKLLEQYSQISQNLGYGAVKQLPPDLRGGGDISYVASGMQANLVGLGPFGDGEHSPQESLEIDTLVMQSQRAALLMYALIGK
jgi:glutamate carboxypeptidase